MTITIRIRLPRSMPSEAGLRGTVRALLPVAEPAVLLVAEATGAGLVGKIICATALRAARQALAPEPVPAAPTGWLPVVPADRLRPAAGREAN